MRRTLFFFAIFLATSQANAITQISSFRSSGAKHRFSFDPEILEVHAESKKTGIPVTFLATEAKGLVTNEILLRANDAKALTNALSKVNGHVAMRDIPYSNGVKVITFASILEAVQASEALIGAPGIEWVHPDFILDTETRSHPSNEPFFSSQWNLQNTGQNGGATGADINILPAWERTTGNPSVLVAVIDLGFEQEHPDLKEAWYINAEEIPGNRIDDDGNGFKDDVSGWNFAVGSNNLIYGANAAHGTSASGIIGARANGRGVTGICPECKVLPIVIDAEVETAVAGFYYAKAFGAQVISNSWGYKIGTPRMDAVIDAINRTARDGRIGKGVSIVFAMSNFGRNDCREPEPDISSLESVIAVSSVDQNDLKVSASAYGPCMDFVAPTSGSTVNAVATTDRPGTKGYNKGDNPDDFSDLDFTHTFYGTSAATPQVAGALALLYSLDSNLTADRALTALKQGADKIQPELAGYDDNGHSQSYGFGRINVGRSVLALLNAQ